jgi:hypothetical protein
MSVMNIREFFESHKIKLEDEGNFVMCVDDSYTQSFKRGKFYPIINGCVKGNAVNLHSTDETRLNKTFVALQGAPDSLTLRDKLMITLRIS